MSIVYTVWGRSKCIYGARVHRISRVRQTVDRKRGRSRDRQTMEKSRTMLNTCMSFLSVLPCYGWVSGPVCRWSAPAACQQPSNPRGTRGQCTRSPSTSRHLTSSCRIGTNFNVRYLSSPSAPGITFGTFSLHRVCFSSSLHKNLDWQIYWFCLW